MLLVCVLVLMTLSLGSRIIEKNDLNHMADVAAYNQAVVTARTFNSISLINRTQVSHMVALAGVQSLISWTGAYRGSVAMLRGQFAEKKKKPKDDCDKAVGEGASTKTRSESDSCGCVAQIEIEQEIEQPLMVEEARIAASWDALDGAAGAQARAIHEEAELMYLEQLALYRDELLQEVGEHKLVDRMVAEAKQEQPVPDELKAPNVTDEISQRELGAALECGKEAGDKKGLACVPNGPNSHAVWAAMGTRGWAFTTSRAGQAGPMMARLAAILPPNVSVSMSLTGSGYFADDMVHGMASTTNQKAWADDHLSMGVAYELAAGTKCSKKGGFGAKGDAWVKSSHGEDEHYWPSSTEQAPPRAGNAVPTADPVPSPRHTVGLMWPRFLDYNPTLLSKPEDGYGQPKTYGMLQRDYSVRERAQPWEKMFRFGFASSGRAGELDLRGNRARNGSSLQTALVSGIAYYHRPGHWREPPNFFNPFWRATLMASDLLDQQTQDDVPKMLNESGAGDAAKTFQLLYLAGYRGY